jgi:hypothetical protein
MNVSVSKAKSAATDTLAIVAGLVAGKFAMDFASGKLPGAAVPALGLLGLVPHFSNIGGEMGKQVGSGLLAAGFIQAAKNFTSGKSGLLAQVNSALPSLSGFAGYAGLSGLHENPDFQSLAAPAEMAQPMMDERSLLFN